MAKFAPISERFTPLNLKEVRLPMDRAERMNPEKVDSATDRRARWPEDLELVRRLWRDYRQWLADHADHSPSAERRTSDGLALIDALIAELPGSYAPPRGDVLLWYVQDELVACGALRELGPKVGEIKRIYIRSDFRGKTFGHPFVRTLMNRARDLGFRTLRADTLPTMRAAIEFYQELGFRPISSYWPHPVAGAIYYEVDLEHP